MRIPIVNKEFQNAVENSKIAKIALENAIHQLMGNSQVTLREIMLLSMSNMLTPECYQKPSKSKYGGSGCDLT